MYCKKCGRYIGTDENLCDICKQKEIAKENVYVNENNYNQNYGYNAQNPYAEQNSTTSAPAYNGPTGTPALGKAITSLVLGEVGFIFGVLIFAMGLTSLFFGLAFFGFLICLGTNIPALILGISGLKSTSLPCPESKAKRIVTKILSIVGLASAAFYLFYILIFGLAGLSLL